MTPCPRCGGNSIKRGRDQRQCLQCTKYFTDRGSPQVLVFDIETLPVIGTFWDTGKQYINPDNILEDWVVLSWSAKALFSPNIIGDILTSEEAKRRLKSVLDPKLPPHNADERIVRRIWKMLDSAQAVITQNGKKFDVRKLNARFIYYGLPPYRPFHHIDTLEAARAAFGTSSHKLDYMTKFLSLDRKLPTNYELWKGCMYGDSQSLKTMYDYGINDTWILEDYYAYIRAWIPKHPNFSAYTHNYVDLNKGEVACPVCRHVITPASLSDKYQTPMGYQYVQFRCHHCGAVGRKNERIPKQKIEVRGVL